MSQDLPIPRQDDRHDGTTVVEWGDADEAPPGRVGRSLAGLGRDHRLPPVLVGLGAVAALASLIGEWLVITLPNDDQDGDDTLRLPSGVAEIGGFGVAYLVGLLGLSVAVALALRGAPAVRRHARIAGLGLAAPLLGVLVAAAASLQQLARRIVFFSTEQSLQVQHGRGLVTAFLAVALLAVALHLTGRTGDRGTDPVEVGAEPSDEPPGTPARRRRRSADDEAPPAPADLTVEPTVPFAGPERSR
ncbi:hypothetical protein GA0070622_0547 [Micromonospora sediminicola]|uniref:Tryptophan-associated transmembrane protein (Trp_oprn_chp) n=1 Tax=Micromonospora sediminicola TaxID=946078 RepID=A0A1A9B3V0_9ACTN|nr:MULTISPECIES: hypothetical protein [Micromonospora]PGH41829.1 hypothetical protein COO58_25235 [Micromonospora sp. WMMA1996]SBT63592.1 hypothetical protein GA0070622_0547 [Micromonospora sediminicola]